MVEVADLEGGCGLVGKGATASGAWSCDDPGFGGAGEAG